MDRKLKINYEIYINTKVGKWLVKSYVYLKKRIHFICECECGTSSTIQASNLLAGHSKSCKYCAPTKHGYLKTPTYRAWNGARNRCNNPNNKDYDNYGGRGIRMCERWSLFQNFLADMGEAPEKLSLDRINNDGNYEPGNCRWATKSQQNFNQRKRKYKK